jgi:cobalt-precorrin 5A hydrolase
VSHSPRDLVVGLGCRPGVPPDNVRAVLDALLSRHALHPAGVLAYATLIARVDEPGLRAVAGDALLCYPATALASVTVPNPSRKVAASVGTPAVAEAAALLAATELAPPGASVELIGPKLAGAGVTVAVARIRP